MLDYPQKHCSAPCLQEGHLLIVFSLHACKRQNFTVQYSTCFKKKNDNKQNIHFVDCRFTNKYTFLVLSFSYLVRGL